MLSRLRPLDLELIFEDRPYKLGRTINLTVELNPRGDVQVREGRVDLVCEERYTQSYTAMVRASRMRPGGFQRGTLSSVVEHEMTAKVPKQVTKEHRETYVPSSVVFLTDERLKSGKTTKYKARLEIPPELPRHPAKGIVGWKVKWNMMVVVDVARARDITKKRPVKVTLA